MKRSHVAYLTVGFVTVLMAVAATQRMAHSDRPVAHGIQPLETTCAVAVEEAVEEAVAEEVAASDAPEGELLVFEGTVLDTLCFDIIEYDPALFNFHLFDQAGFAFVGDASFAIQDGPSPLAMATPVPEPMTLSLLGVGAMALLRRRAKR